MPTKTGAKRLPSKEDATRRVLTDPAISLADLAAITGVSLATVHRQVAANALPVKTVRIGQRWIVTSASVREMLDLEPVKASA